MFHNLRCYKNCWIKQLWSTNRLLLFNCLNRKSTWALCSRKQKTSWQSTSWPSKEQVKAIALTMGPSGVAGSHTVTLRSRAAARTSVYRSRNSHRSHSLFMPCHVKMSAPQAAVCPRINVCCWFTKNTYSKQTFHFLSLLINIRPASAEG